MMTDLTRSFLELEEYSATSLTAVVFKPSCATIESVVTRIAGMPKRPRNYGLGIELELN